MREPLVKAKGVDGGTGVVEVLRVVVEFLHASSNIQVVTRLVSILLLQGDALLVTIYCPLEIVRELVAIGCLRVQFLCFVCSV